MITDALKFGSFDEFVQQNGWNIELKPLEEVTKETSGYNRRSWRIADPRFPQKGPGGLAYGTYANKRTIYTTADTKAAFDRFYSLLRNEVATGKWFKEAARFYA